MAKNLNDNTPVNPFETSVFSGMGLNSDFDRKHIDPDPDVDLSAIREMAMDGFEIPTGNNAEEQNDTAFLYAEGVAASEDGVFLEDSIGNVSDAEDNENVPDFVADEESTFAVKENYAVLEDQVKEEILEADDANELHEKGFEIQCELSESDSAEDDEAVAEKTEEIIEEEAAPGLFAKVASGISSRINGLIRPNRVLERKTDQPEELDLQDEIPLEELIDGEPQSNVVQSAVISDGSDERESVEDNVETTEMSVPASEDENGSEQVSAALIGIAPKSMTIQGQLKKWNDATIAEDNDSVEGNDLSFGLEAGGSAGIKTALRKGKKAISKKTGKTIPFLQNESFRKFGAVAAIFALLTGSICYFGSLIKTADKFAARSVSYLFSSNSAQRVAVADPLSADLIERATQVYLRGSSVEEDLNVVVTDFSGNNVSGIPFVFSITDPEGKVQKYTDEDKDGELNIDGLVEGDYLVELHEAEGYIAPEPIVVKVQPKVEYIRIADIGEKIVDQDQVDLSEDDMQYGGRDPGGETPTTTGDTVEYVPSSSKEVEKEKTRTVTKFTGHTDETGRLYYSSGELSNVIPMIDSDGFMTGEYTLYQEIYSLTVVAETGGTASASVSSASAYTEISVNAVPDDGYVFSGWSCSAGDNPFFDPLAAKTTFVMPPANVTITASFTPAQTSTKEYTLTVSSGNGGTASASTSKVAAGTSVSITAIPSDGYVFAGWSSSGGGTFKDIYGSTTTFVMPANNVTITASFAVDTSGGAVGGDINIFAKDANGNYVFDITPQTITETYIEKETVYYGWQNRDGKTYYYDKHGKMVYGTQVIQGVTYIFAADGSLVKGDAVQGIDVSTWQGSIDWNAVASSGIRYVFIRIGFRGYGTGKIVEDNRFLENIRGAKAAGLKVGVYFYSQAINAAEAVEEASATLELLRGYSVDYPIIIDMEDAGSSSARTVGLTRSELTKITVAFCETVRNSGYSAMVYANKYWLEYKLDPSQFGSYYIWLAHYTGGSVSSYAGRYEVWQYTSVGKVNGISGNVDMNYSYMG